MVVKDLKSLKYQELQKLAKSAGIKANQKIDKLIKALEEHYMENTSGTELASSYMVKTCSSTKSNTPQPQLKANNGLRGKSGTPVSALDTKKGNMKPATASTSHSEHTNKQPKKRRRTFELEEPTLSEANTPTADSTVQRRTTRSTSRSNTPIEAVPAAKRQRKNTYDKTDSPVQDSCGSPGTTAMIASIDATQNSAERKSNLLSAIDKKIQNKVAKSPSKTSSQPSQIPRFMAYLASMKKEAQGQSQSKPVTPGSKDWTKIHKKEFSRFDSLDVYLEKKQQRKDKLTNSGKRLNPRLTARNNTKIVKPVARPQVPVKPFVPSVTSIKNLSFNFVKTPSNQPITVPALPKSSKPGIPQAQSKTPRPKTPSVSTTRKSAGSTNRATPYKFTGGNTNNSMNTTVNSASKKVFDLKASLARPLTWKPHTGKLQPLDINNPGVAAPKSVAPVMRSKLSARPTHQAMASKSRPTNAKEVRRVQQLDRRNNQKYVEMMRRRGLMN